MTSGGISESLYERLFREGEERVYDDIPQAAQEDVPRNFFVSLLGLCATKTGDVFLSPQLILTWLLTSLGAPVYLVGAMVPVREAGALLPQIFIAGVLERRAIRKKFWVTGSAVQGAAVLAIAFAGLTLDGAPAGWAAIGALVVFSLARGVCSVTIKDLMGKTVPRTRRGRLSGAASTVAGIAATGMGVLFFFVPRETLSNIVLVAVLFVAAALWLIAAAVLSRLREPSSPIEEHGYSWRETVAEFGLLARDKVFLRFCISRGLLASTILSMPYYVILAREATNARAATLGLLAVATGAAGLLSAYAWGWLADRSSRWTLVAAGGLAGAIGCATYVVGGIPLQETTAPIAYGTLFFLLGLAHSGIRLGRQTYIVDLAPQEQKAAYTAVSNTLMGIVLVLSTGLGALAGVLTDRGIILLFGLLGLVGAAMGMTLREVER